MKLRSKSLSNEVNAIISWCAPEKIAAFYLEARRLTKETGIKHEVDHIDPLKHDLVSGLHHEDNLQILPKADNVRKLNSFESFEVDYLELGWQQAAE